MVASRESAPSIAELLARPGIEPGERRILLGHALGVSRIELVSQSQRTLSAAELARCDALVARRRAGEPIAYLVGEREFYGRSFAVGPAVLIPRPVTELLVEVALEHLPGDTPLRILDLGSGSGVLAVTLALARPSARVTAVDNSGAALGVARANATALGASVTFVESDWYAALARERFDLIVCNPPYVAADDAHLEEGDLRFEPPGALSAGTDGLAALAHVIAAAPNWLETGGWLFVEHGFDQASRVRSAFAASGFGAIGSWLDLAGIERVSGGRHAST